MLYFIVALYLTLANFPLLNDSIFPIFVIFVSKDCTEISGDVKRVLIYCLNTVLLIGIKSLGYVIDITPSVSKLSK